MVSVTENNRSCVLLRVLSALTIVFWPVLSVSCLTTPNAFTPPVGNSNISTIYLTTPAILKPSTSALSPTSSPQASTTTPSKSMSATSTMSHFDQTSQRELLISSLLSYLPPRPCKDLTPPLKTRGPHLHRNRCHLSKMTSGKSPLHTARLPFPPPNSTSIPQSLPSSPLPQTALPKRPSPLPTSSISTAFLPLTSKTSPPIPLPETSQSPPEAAASRPSGPRPPPPLPHTTGPLFEHQPFIVSWNIPDLVCNRYNISLDTSPFKGVATPAKVPGQFLSLFYTDRLGLYPHVDLARRKQINGGIPQRGNLKASMSKAREDINYYIPSKTSRGLAVIDWEEWRPLWDRNWGTKRIYQTLSVAHLMRTNRSMTVHQATEKAKQHFQVAAKSFMSGMLAMGRTMRPNYLWGFYLFPNCYNYVWEKPNYTGRCSKEVRRQNDELLWLWESSTALYPSVYLQASCAALSFYLSSTLNPYINNVTLAAQLCSSFLCRGNGRCVRKNSNSNHYLHLNPDNFRILHVQKRYLVLGRPSLTDLKALSRRFTCQCYKGLSCSPRTYRELSKALVFSVKQGLFQKFHTLNKAMLDDAQQASITKDNVKKNMKV
ncbi:hyaluronidase PH-20-like isoform X4 [Pseudoliparis swirei]|uniref:hyaluronidase PH-20-like isoform X4 n=1 Tax=Pseudoliparis swirei TaxID=2059687 RepID=UPI0024BEF1B6|nr:hyaluronidase PH-20-like isoform X4 [Pseudoliparis swirei]